MRHAITIFAVDDVQRSVRFYETVFGARPRVDAGVYAELDMPDGPAIGLYQRAGFATNTARPVTRPAAGETAGAELYFRVDDVDACVERALAAGAALLLPAAQRPWGEVVAYVADPDGFVLAFARPGHG